ncbi:hypothetical protein FOE78_18530 [Microlunatus elymi]|uniref:Uncharacterized protein n=1 Tax=Microlunatus elymi TaxID=2596828 RepID=A0A516Q2I2_9ACTN|nr:hypothetical protein [Microlunatus elymi]QDP97640.1 hypothetical protein FOE78_18530 [Microlunatus elymi]
MTRYDAQPPVSRAAAADEPGTEVAPVDWQADPAHWLPGRSLLIVAGAALLALIITVVICLLMWSTPAMTPLHIPSVAKA